MSSQSPREARRFPWFHAVGTLLLAAGATSLPGSAGATLHTYEVSRLDAAFAPLVEGEPGVVVLVPTEVNNGQVADHPLPFPVRFYGEAYETLHIGTNGFASFIDPATQSSNRRIPLVDAPNGLLAPWWDNMWCAAGQLKAATVGTAPDRRFGVEWNCTEVHPGSEPWYRVHMQLWLHESSSVIEFHYGSVLRTWAATVGVEDPTGQFGIDPLGCSPSCNRADFPAGSIVRFTPYVLAPDLAVTAVQGEPQVQRGASMEVSVTVANRGNVALDARGIELALRRTRGVGEGAVPLGAIGGSFALEPGETHVAAGPVTVPADLPDGIWYLVAAIDTEATDVVPDNDTGSYGPIAVGRPAPDLRVGAVRITQTTQSDGMLRFSWDAVNDGNAYAHDVPYAVLLSANNYISGADRVISGGRFDVEHRLTLDEAIELPADVAPGQWYVGVIVDPDDEVYELDEYNNTGVSSVPVRIATDTLHVITTSLPPAAVGAPWCTALEAAGGDGTFTWTLVEGALPPGLALLQEGRSSLICGQPRTVGSWAFTVEVASAGRTARQALSIEVLEAELPLTIPAVILGDAMWAQPWEAALAAVGGRAPYTWSLTAGALPAGLQLSAAGVLRGSPQEDGTFSFTVTVQDAAAAEASAALELRVLGPNRLTCVTTAFPAHGVGAPFADRVRVAGGSDELAFSSGDSRRLGDGRGDMGQIFPGAPPPGLELAADGTVTGTPAAAGEYLWSVDVEDERSGERISCAVSLQVRADHGIAVTTRSLPEALVNAPYLVTLAQSGGRGVVRWSLAPGSTLPEGFVLAEEGVLEGTGSSALLDEAASRDFSFLVQVIDEENRRAVAALSFRLLAKRPAAPGGPGDGGGCQAGAGGPALLGMGLALALLRRRR